MTRNDSPRIPLARRLGIVAGLLVALAGFAIAQSASPKAGKWEGGIATFIVTYGHGQAWHPYNAPEDIDAQEKFVSKVRELKKTNPGALLVDLGGFTAPVSFKETAYSNPTMTFFVDEGYDAVHVTAKDYFHFGASGRGVKYTSPEQQGILLGSIDKKEYGRPILRTSNTAEKDAGKVHFMAVSNEDNIAGVPYVIERAQKIPPQEVIEPVLAEKEGLAVLLSGFGMEENEKLAAEFPGIDLIFSSKPGPAETRTAGKTLLVPRAAETEIQIIRARLGEDGFVESVVIERIPWIAREELDAILNPPQPLIGMGVPIQNVVADRFDVEDDTVIMDRFYNDEFQDLTGRQNIYFYHFDKDGVPYRVVRVNHMLRQGWVHMDALAQINPDHTIKHLETNMPEYGILFFPTRLGEGFEHIYNKPPEEWDVPPDTIAGFEKQAEEVLQALRQAIELDRRLFPD